MYCYNGGPSRHHINQLIKVNTANNCTHRYHVSLRGCTEKYIVFHPKMLNLIIRKESESSNLRDVWQLELGLQKYQWHERQKEETKEIRKPNAMCHPWLDPRAGEEKNNKHFKGHYWDTWGNLNMSCMLDNIIASMSNFLSIIIKLRLHKRMFLFFGGITLST